MHALLRQAIHRSIFPVIERLWLVGFSLAGRLSQGTFDSWRPVGGGTVLVVSPHPDDETIGCGGAILLHRRANDRVVVVQVTDGRGSQSGGLAPDDMAERRLKEGAAAAEALGAEMIPLGLPEGEWSAELVDRLGSLMADLNPDVIYGPSPVDYHPEHVKVARALAAAIPRSGRPVVRVCEFGVPLTPVLTNLVANVAPVELQRQAALDAYDTQAISLRTVARLRCHNRALLNMPGAIECFWELRPEQYRTIVTAGDWTWPATPYRGMRLRPFLDPLCYLRGRTERRRLRAISNAVSEILLGY